MSCVTYVDALTRSDSLISKPMDLNISILHKNNSIL